eukprot:14878668-Ditylum_brightwellii.AAC.1
MAKKYKEILESKRKLYKIDDSKQQGKTKTATQIETEAIHTLTPNSTQEAIYQQEQPNGCYFHREDHHLSVQCNTLNLLLHNAGCPRHGAASPLQLGNGGQGGGNAGRGSRGKSQFAPGG